MKAATWKWRARMTVARVNWRTRLHQLFDFGVVTFGRCGVESAIGLEFGRTRCDLRQGGRCKGER
jgi:hypothetical protein